jgi:hypothetical protein
MCQILCGALNNPGVRVKDGRPLGPLQQTGLKGRRHCILRSLIGRKGRDRPSSLYTRM